MVSIQVELIDEISLGLITYTQANFRNGGIVIRLQAQRPKLFKLGEKHLTVSVSHDHLLGQQAWRFVRFSVRVSATSIRRTNQGSSIKFLVRDSEASLCSVHRTYYLIL